MGPRQEKYLVVTHITCWITQHLIPHLLKLLILHSLFGHCRWNISVKCNLIHRAGFKLMEVSVVEKASDGQRDFCPEEAIDLLLT